MAKSIMQEEKKCYITGTRNGLHQHHIFAGANRKNADKWGCWIWLRADWHNASNYGVHYNRELDLKLKKECQKKFEELYGHDKFMEVFKKNWL